MRLVFRFFGLVMVQHKTRIVFQMIPQELALRTMNAAVTIVNLFALITIME